MQDSRILISRRLNRTHNKKMAAFMRKRIPTFSPTNISGCQVWFDAADGSTVVAPNGPVLSWTSKGGVAMTATPSGTAPTYS